MEFNNLLRAKFIRRYKRFFMESQLEDKSIVIAHIANTGSMKSLLEEGNEVFLEKNNDEKRKLKYTCHFMRLKNGAFVCVNTHIPNILVYEAIINNKISIFSNFSNIKREFKYGEENSKIDIFLERNNKKIFIEIKNVTLMEDILPNIAQFPDARSGRGEKHLRELIKEIEKGNETYMIYLINREDAKKFKIAQDIDPKYKNAYDKAKLAGVKMLALKTKFEFNEKTNQIKISCDDFIESLD